MLNSGITSINVPIQSAIDQILAYYGDNKDSLDRQINRSMDFEYDVVDSFEQSGQKVPSILAHNALFIDCHYLNKDFYSIVFDLALVLKQHNYGLFVLARSRLNQILVFLRDTLQVCEFVPEVDIVLKDQMQLYMKPFEQTRRELREIQGHLKTLLSTNLDGSVNSSRFSM